jgi:hypothetical protein
MVHQPANEEAHRADLPGAAMEPTMSLPNEDHIPIERLTTGTVVYRKNGDFGSFGAYAEVTAVEFDDEGYLVTALFMEGAHGSEYAGTEEVQFWVECGESVTHGGDRAPVLRSEASVTAREWAAKADANGAAIDVAIGQLNKLQGHVCQPIDEALLVGAVADAIGVLALQAAE